MYASTYPQYSKQDAYGGANTYKGNAENRPTAPFVIVRV